MAVICIIRVLKTFKKPDGTSVPEGSIIEVPCEEIEALLESKTVALVRISSTGEEQSC